jgi:hypothetical protein
MRKIVQRTGNEAQSSTERCSRGRTITPLAAHRATTTLGG